MLYSSNFDKSFIEGNVNYLKLKFEQHLSPLQRKMFYKWVLKELERGGISTSVSPNRSVVRGSFPSFCRSSNDIPHILHSVCFSSESSNSNDLLSEEDVDIIEEYKHSLYGLISLILESPCTNITQYIDDIFQQIVEHTHLLKINCEENESMTSEKSSSTCDENYGYDVSKELEMKDVIIAQKEGIIEELRLELEETKKRPHVLLRDNSELTLVGPFVSREKAWEWAKENESVNDKYIDNWNLMDVNPDKNVEDILTLVTSC